jgi:hypothetical protein
MCTAVSFRDIFQIFNCGQEPELKSLVGWEILRNPTEYVNLVQQMLFGVIEELLVCIDDSCRHDTSNDASCRGPLSTASHHETLFKTLDLFVNPLRELDQESRCRLVPIKNSTSG